MIKGFAALPRITLLELNVFPEGKCGHKKNKKIKNEKEENMNIGSQKPTKSVFQQYNRIDRWASILKESSAYSAQHWRIHDWQLY